MKLVLKVASVAVGILVVSSGPSTLLRASPQSQAPQTVERDRRAAEQGDADAQHRLGRAYQDGNGVVQDETEAVRWFRLAADQGYAVAQGNLGIAYTGGVGAPQDS